VIEKTSVSKVASLWTFNNIFDWILERRGNKINVRIYNQDHIAINTTETGKIIRAGLHSAYIPQHLPGLILIFIN